MRSVHLDRSVGLFSSRHFFNVFQVFSRNVKIESTETNGVRVVIARMLLNRYSDPIGRKMRSCGVKKWLNYIDGVPLSFVGHYSHSRYYSDSGKNRWTNDRKLPSVAIL